METRLPDNEQFNWNTQQEELEQELEQWWTQQDQDTYWIESNLN